MAGCSWTCLLLANSTVLIPAVGHLALVGARVPPQAGFARLVKQAEDGEGCSPQDDTKAPCNDAVQIPGANRAAEGALEAQRQDCDGCKEIGAGDCKQDEGGRKVGMGRPDHGDLAFAQLEVAVPPIDAEGVHQHEDDGAAQDDYQQAQT